VLKYKFKDNVGFNLFIDTFKNYDLANCLVGLESTSIYGDNLTTFLFEKGFKIGRINPIQTDSLRSSNIRKTKNDKIDTFLIAQCLMLGHYTLITEKDIQFIKLKTLCRFKFDIKKSQSKAKTQFVTCLDIAFPELANFFNDNLHIKSSYALLSKYPTARIIANTRIDALTNLLYFASRGHFKMDKALALKELAKNSIAMDNPAIGVQIKMLIEQIQMLEKQIDLLDIEISNIMEQLDSPISSIPSIVAIYLLSSFFTSYSFPLIVTLLGSKLLLFVLSYALFVLLKETCISSFLAKLCFSSPSFCVFILVILNS